MPSLTLKGIPDDVMSRLRRRADAERRSLNQVAIRLLERALDDPRPSFSGAFEAFLEANGPTPFTDDEAAFARSRESRRSGSFGDSAEGGAAEGGGTEASAAGDGVTGDGA